jgi:hypothetical protein
MAYIKYEFKNGDEPIEVNCEGIEEAKKIIHLLLNEKYPNNNVPEITVTDSFTGKELKDYFDKL